MRILIFNWRDLKHSWAGGGEIYIFELAKRWVTSGHEVTVFCSQNIGKKLKAEEKYLGINIVRRGGRFSIYFWAFWYYLTRFRSKFDLLVDVENGIPFFTPMYSSKPKVAIVYHVHGGQFFYELRFPVSHIGFLMEKYVFPVFYRSIPIIAISETTKKELTKIGFKRNKIHVVRCGIDGKAVIRKPARKKFSKPTILYLGRIKAYKRVELLIDVLPKVIEKIPNAKVIIAGWGTEASNLVDLAMKSKYRKRIKIVGPVSEAEKKRLLARSWVFVNPSIGEGWSIAVIEANLYGTPAVGFNVTGLRESIVDGKTGYLAGNKEDFADKVIEVLSNKKTRRIMERNALKWARKFSWEDASRVSEKILKGCLTQ